MTVVVEREITGNADNYLTRLARGLPLIEVVEISVDHGMATCDKPCRPGCSIRVGTREGPKCTGVTRNGTRAPQKETPLYEYAQCGMRGL